MMPLAVVALRLPLIIVYPTNQSASESQLNRHYRLDSRKHQNHKLSKELGPIPMPTSSRTSINQKHPLQNETKHFLWIKLENFSFLQHQRP